MTITRFQPVWTHRKHKGKCGICGKTTTRSKSFEHTINPWNRNEDGSVRTYEEVRERVNAEADAWQPDFDHWTCVEREERRKRGEIGNVGWPERRDSPARDMGEVSDVAS